MVTVDTLTWKNKVIWEKAATGGITEFKIYKETSVNEYTYLGSVPYALPGAYVDVSSVPEMHGDKYKITAVDTCGDESLYSPFHKTMNLTIAAFGSTMGLNWDDYVDESGQFVASKYFIYRGTSPSTMALYDSVSGSFTSYNDINIFNLYYYMIGVKKLGGCDNTKSDLVSYSNKKDNSFIGIGDNLLNAGTIIISPNPMSNYTTLSIPNLQSAINPLAIKIIDITGKVVRVIYERELENIKINSSSNLQIQIERGDLVPGIYFVELKVDRVYRGKFVVE
jgi:hypothetical protein